MSKICPKCSSEVPKHCVIDGKRYNLQRRKYCFKCSPFLSHNTKPLEQASDGSKKFGCQRCKSCGKVLKIKGTKCFACVFAIRKRRIIEKIQSLVGCKCWICGYNKSWKSICFHHVDPKQKKFDLSGAMYSKSWETVLSEMKKCILICNNCHGEVHDNLISDAEIDGVYKSGWLSAYSTTVSARDS